MFLPLEKLLALGLVTVTNDKLVVCCKTIYVIECTYKKKPLHIVKHAITIALPTALKSLAPEQLHDQDIGLHIEVDPIRSRNEQIKAMAELSYAPAPLQATIPAPVLEGNNLTATICVATTHSSFLPDGAQVVEQIRTCTIAQVTVDPTSITYVGGTQYSLKLAKGGVLIFTFHRSIAQQAMELLEKARNDGDKVDGHQISKKPINDDTRAILPPTPLFNSDGEDNKTSESWADDAENAENASRSSSPITPPVSPVPITPPASPVPITPPASHDSPVLSIEQEQPKASAPILAKTPHADIVKFLTNLARKKGLDLKGDEQQHSERTMYFIDVSEFLAKEILKMRVSAWGNEIVAGILTDDETMEWGTCVNIHHSYYDALVAMFPEMGDTVQHVIQTRKDLQIKKPHHYKVMYVPVPVFMTYPSYPYPLYA